MSSSSSSSSSSPPLHSSSSSSSSSTQLSPKCRVLLNYTFPLLDVSGDDTEPADRCAGGVDRWKYLRVHPPGWPRRDDRSAHRPPSVPRPYTARYALWRVISIVICLSVSVLFSIILLVFSPIFCSFHNLKISPFKRLPVKEKSGPFLPRCTDVTVITWLAGDN